MAALIFDLDGTLLNSRDCILESIRYGFESIGLRRIVFDEVSATQLDLATTFKNTMRDNQLDFEEEDLNIFIQEYRDYHMKEAEELISVYEGVEEGLDHLRSKFRFAVATTKCSEQAERVLKSQGLRDFFDHVQGTDPGLRYKPHPDIIESCLKRLDVDGSKASYAGDSPHDMEAATRAGVLRIGAGYGYGGHKALAGCSPEWLINHFNELLGLREEILGAYGQAL